ncbi:hypothetical protein Pelo_5697 [Pelomyxa schiedti]|nr:hypothetical protein Pelo_5697 [Pelomyxa schiedti]
MGQSPSRGNATYNHGRARPVNVTDTFNDYVDSYEDDEETDQAAASGPTAPPASPVIPAASSTASAAETSAAAECDMQIDGVDGDRGSALLVADNDGTLHVRESPYLDASVENNNARPHVVSFIGETQIGKSFLTDSLLTVLGYGPDLPRPQIGAEIASTTKGVHYYTVGDTFFLDFEGSHARVSEPKQENVINCIFPRIAYSISSTIVYITRSTAASKTPLDDLWSPLNNESYKKPDLVIVFNGSHAEKFDDKPLRTDPRYNQLESLFSHVDGFYLCDKAYKKKFQTQLANLIHTLLHHQLPLASHKWIRLVKAVVNWFNSPKRGEPIPLCNIYASLIDDLEPPLDRVQRLFLDCIPNRVCTHQQFIECCAWAKRALPVVVAVHLLHLQVEEVSSAHYRKQYDILVTYLRSFIPCAACIELGGITYKCGVQHRFHSNHKHEANNGEQIVKKWRSEFEPVGYIEDDAEGVRQAETAAILRVILGNKANHIDCNWVEQRHDWGPHHGALPPKAKKVLKEFMAIRKMNLLIKNAGLGVTLGASIGVACATPIAIGVGFATMGLGIPISVIIVGAGGTLGASIGGAVCAANAERKPEEAKKEMMEAASLLAYAKGGWNVVTLVESLDHIIFVKIDNI